MSLNGGVNSSIGWPQIESVFDDGFHTAQINFFASSPRNNELPARVFHPVDQETHEPRLWAVLLVDELFEALKKEVMEDSASLTDAKQLPYKVFRVLAPTLA